MNIKNRREFLGTVAAPLFASSRTIVEIKDQRFQINGEPTYKGRQWRGHKIEGLLLNSRMVQGIFDDENSATVSRWDYKDSGKWDPERNTRDLSPPCPSGVVMVC